MVIERKTGSRRPTAAARDVRDARVHGASCACTGARRARRHAAVHVGSARRTATALSFEELRTKVIEICRDGVPLQRFKGLGEMNADQLFDTTMDPESRTLQLVTVDDASAADQVFSMLMGDAVEPRREFIESHAREVTNLDV
jgi:DNA gyrase/topoisomerase IV subunit B